MRIALVLLSVLLAVSAKTYFHEKFDDQWRSRWVDSKWKVGEGSQGTFNHTAGKWYGNAEDKGIQTGHDYRFYTTSARLSQPFKRKVGAEKKTLVVQFSIKHEQNWIECGGGYIKLLPGPLDQPAFNNESPASLVFGPDLCGTQTKDVHVTFRAGNELVPIKKHIRCESNKLTHFYTLILNSDDTYEVRIDGARREQGSLAEDWDFPAGAKLAINEKELNFVGIEIWQVKAGSVYDNILITDSVEEADAVIRKFDEESREDERHMWEEADKIMQAEEDRIRKSIEEERKRQDEELAARLREEGEQEPTTVTPTPKPAAPVRSASDAAKPSKPGVPTKPVPDSPAEERPTAAKASTDSKPTATKAVPKAKPTPAKGKKSRDEL